MKTQQILAVVGILLAMTASASAAPVLTNGLIGYYSFDNASNLAAGQDGTGNDRSGTLYQHPGSVGSIYGITGHIGGAAYFDALCNSTGGTWTTGNLYASSYINLPALTYPTSNFTIASWYNWRSDVGGTAGSLDLFSGALSGSTTSADLIVEIQRSTPRWRLAIANGSNQAINPSDSSGNGWLSTAPAAGTWHHIAMTYNSNADTGSDYKVRFYMDGVNVFNSNVTLAPSEGELMGDWAGVTRIGALGSLSSGETIPRRAWLGGMDELYLFNRTLSAAEISNVMNNIPEPSSLFLMITAGLSALVLRRGTRLIWPRTTFGARKI